MNRTFDFYEFAGVLVPGAVLLLGVALLHPEAKALFSKEGVTFGELGILAVIAYAAGHLVQTLGNVIEELLWKIFRGGHSCYVLRSDYVNAQQKRQIIEALQSKLNLTVVENEPLPLSIPRQVYSVVANASKTKRIDIFNANYGLARGLAASLLVLLVLAWWQSQSCWVLGVIALLFVFALQRMHRFGRHYATELYVEFLSCKEEPTPKAQNS